MKQAIYEIMEDYRQLYEMATDEEMGEQFAQALKDTKESLDYTLEQKAYNCAKVCKNIDYSISQLDGQAEFLKKELDRVNTKKKTFENNKKAIRNMVLEAMEFADINKFKNEEFTIYTQKSTSVKVLDVEKALANNMAAVEIIPDKKAIGNALKAGQALDFAVLKESKNLIIR